MRNRAADPAGGMTFRTVLPAPPFGKRFVTAPNGKIEHG
jgi:hypothetical protein